MNEPIISQEEYVLDATSIDIGCAAFCPYDRKSGIIMTGLTILQDRCPGRLVGVFHAGGQKVLEEWIKDHPDWKENYSRIQED